MDYKALLKSILPHLGAIVFFLILSAIYMSPVFEGKTLKMHDISQYRGMAKEIFDHRETFGDEPLWTGSMFSGMPAFQISAQYGYNLLKSIDKAFRLWMPRPLDFLFIYMLGFYLMLLKVKVDWRLAIPGAVAFAFSSYFIIILAAGHTSKANAIAFMPPVLGAFWMLFKHRKWYFGTALLALFLALEMHANHLQITYYLGILLGFLLIGFFVEDFKNKNLPAFGKSFAGLILASLLALGANSGNILSTYQYTKLSTRGPSELTINPLGEPDNSDKTKGLDRSYVTAWSYGIDETLTLFIPNAKGGASAAVGSNHEGLKVVEPNYREMVAGSSQYWGTQSFTSGPVYVGASVFILFMLACLLLKGWLKYSLLSALALTVMLSWGKNFMGLTDFFLDYIPLYNKFRAVTIILVVAQLIIPLMAMLLLFKIWKNPEIIKNSIKQFFTVFLVFIVSLVVLMLFPTAFFDFFSPAEMENYLPLINGENGNRILGYMDNLERFRIYVFRQDGLRSGFFAFLAMLLVWYFAKGNLNKNVFAISLTLLFIADLLPVNKRYLNNEKERGKYVQWMDREQAIYPFKASKADKGLLQVESALKPEIKDKVEKELKLAQDNKMQREGKRKLSDYERDAYTFKALRGNANFRVLNLAASPFNDASTSYFHRSVGGYHGAKLQRYQELIDFHLNSDIQRLIGGLQNAKSFEDAERVFKNLQVLNMLNTKYIIHNAEATPLTNSYAYGDAWAIRNINFVENANAEILALGEADLQKTVVVNQDFKPLIKSDGEFTGRAKVKLSEYRSNYLSYSYSSESEQFIVFSEIYYPGWQAYVNGNKVEHIPVNYVLRGLLVPAGNHQIEFRFEPEVYNTVRTLQLAGNGILAIVVLVFVFLGFKETNEKKNEIEEIQ
jgi:hypothetical protein